MSQLPLILGIALSVSGIVVGLVFALAPGGPRVPFARRMPVGATQQSAAAAVANLGSDLVAKGQQSAFGGLLLASLQLEQAGIKLKPPVFVFRVAVVGIMLGLLGLILAGGSVWTIPIAALFSTMAPLGARAYVAILANRRRAQFADQLDETLSLFSGALRAGHSLLRAIDAVSRETAAPTSDEFARVVAENRVGRDLGDALSDVSLRMQSEDFRWVSQAIAINREVGGNLAEVFDQVGKTIRERNQIKRQVKALSAEGRLSALVLIALPVGVFFFLFSTQPDYFSGFFESIIGILALAFAVLLLLVGSFWLSKVVKVKF